MLETHVGDTSLIRRYEAEFVGMVVPGDRLHTFLNHAGMRRVRGVCVHVVRRSSDGSVSDSRRGGKLSH